MKPEEVLGILKSCGALIADSHIVYTSGRHGDTYINKDAVYPHTAVISKLCKEIAEYFEDFGCEVVVAPAVGGVILSQWTAYHLNTLTPVNRVGEILGLYAEKSDDGQTFEFRRGYDKLVRGKKVLVVEDILTTGGSVQKVVEAVRRLNGKVEGVGAICNRGGVTTKDIGDVPELYALLDINLDSYPEEGCPFCAKKVPINIKVGKGREYLHQKGQLALET